MLAAPPSQLLTKCPTRQSLRTRSLSKPGHCHPGPLSQSPSARPAPLTSRPSSTRSPCARHQQRATHASSTLRPTSQRSPSSFPFFPERTSRPRSSARSWDPLPAAPHRDHRPAPFNPARDAPCDAPSLLGCPEPGSATTPPPRRAEPLRRRGPARPGHLHHQEPPQELLLGARILLEPSFPDFDPCMHGISLERRRRYSDRRRGPLSSP